MAGRKLTDLDGAEGQPAWRRALFIVLVIISSLALALLVYFAGRASAERDEALAWQRHSFMVMSLANSLDASLANSEALLARYVVSLDAQTGRQFQAEWRDAQAKLGALERATRDNARQQENLAQLRKAVTARGSELGNIALRTTFNQKLDALGHFYQAGKSPDVKAIRVALDRITDVERAMLDRRSLLVNESEMRASRLYDGTSLVGLGLLVAALMAIWIASAAASERRNARQLAAAEAARVDGLEVAVRERTEQLEAANAQLRLEMEERAQAERMLRRMQKLEAIGKLTGGIAHDFNNMLAVVVGGIELARRNFQRQPEKAARHLDSAMDGAQRAAALTRRLLAYARSEPLKPARVEPDQLIAGMSDLIGRTIGGSISLQLDLGAPGWTIWADPAELENALLNLAINARDAMEGQGALTIATAARTLPAGGVGNCRAGDHVEIAVRDTGCGMSPEVLERAFEPFFTTKPIGQGTGLGLSQIFGFVRQCEGEIEIDSTPGAGTTVRLILRREQGLPPGEQPGESATPVGAGADAPTRRLHVLAIEDDDMVLRATLDALEALGHVAVPCARAEDAATMLADHPEIDLIISDVLMPGMTGPETIAALGAARGDRPVIYVTGYAGDGAAAHAIAGEHVLTKPISLDAMARAIDQAMRPHAPAVAAQDA